MAKPNQKVIDFYHKRHQLHDYQQAELGQGEEQEPERESVAPFRVFSEREKQLLRLLEC